MRTIVTKKKKKLFSNLLSYRLILLIVNNKELIYSSKIFDGLISVQKHVLRSSEPKAKVSAIGPWLLTPVYVSHF